MLAYNQTQQAQQIQFKGIEHYQYNLNDVLGRGFSCVVYQGVNKKTQEIVAIKVVEHRSLNEQVSSMVLTNEIENLKKLRSDNILKLHDVFRTVNNTYIITEHCNQGDLGSYIKKNGALKEEPALKVLRHVINGLKELQKHGIAHRDLKPDNILLKDGTPKIADFGFAKSLESISRNAGRELSVGTPIYMSPETLKNNEYSDKTDIWALGVMYYELIFGIIPWKVITVQDLMHQIINVPVTFPPLQPITDHSKDLILRAIKSDPKQRISLNEIFNHPLIRKPKQSYSQNKSYQNSPQLRNVTQVSSEHTTPIPIPRRFAGRNHLHRPSLDVTTMNPKQVGNNESKEIKGITLRALASPSQTQNCSNIWMQKIDKVLKTFIDLCIFMKKLYLLLDTPEMFNCPQMCNRLRFAILKNMMIVISRLRDQLSEESGRRNIMQLLSWRTYVETPGYYQFKSQVDELFPQYERLFVTVYDQLSRSEGFLKEIKEDNDLLSIFDNNLFQFPLFYTVVISSLREAIKDLNNKLLFSKMSPLIEQDYINTLDSLLSYYQLIKLLSSNLSDPYNFADEACNFNKGNGKVLSSSQSQFEHLRRKIKILIN